MMTAAEIKNKFIYSLHWMPETEVAVEWERFVRDTKVSDEYDFVFAMRCKHADRVWKAERFRPLSFCE